LFHFASAEEHFAEHLAPVWHALPERVRGEFWTAPNLVEFARTLVPTAEVRPRWVRVERGDYVVVAGEGDRKALPGVPIVRFEHGVGMSYAGMVNVPVGAPRRAIEGVRTHPSYPGGRGQRGVKLFCSPNRYSDDRWKAPYPGTPSEIVGTPKLDRIHNAPPKVRSNPPVVAVSFHADISIAVEASSAFPDYADVLPSLAKRTDIQLIAHAHPRARNQVRPFYDEHGIEFVERFTEVMELADLYAMDNSSTLYEFASLDRPVVVINRDVYRRDVHHGLRFWEHSGVGVNCDRPKDLNKAIDTALEDPPEFQEARRLATKDCYPYRGRASQRAAEVMMSLERVAV
jgi:hypothetical protein